MVLEKSNGVLLADYPKLPLPEERVDELVLSSVDWAHVGCFVFVPISNSKCKCRFILVSLEPKQVDGGAKCSSRSAQSKM